MQVGNEDVEDLCASPAGEQEGQSEVQGSGNEKEEAIWDGVAPSPDKFTKDLSSGFSMLSRRLRGKLREVRLYRSVMRISINTSPRGASHLTSWSCFASTVD